MDPGRHHDFLSNSDDRSNRSTYYGRELPEITSHHYYGPATAPARTANNGTRKTCGCTIAASGGTTVGSITCNNCRTNIADETVWSTSMTNTNQIDHTQRGAVVSGGAVDIGMAADYHHHRMLPETNVRSNVRQSGMYLQQLSQQPHTQHLQQQQPSHGLIVGQPQHPANVANMTGNRNNYWPQSNLANSGSLSYRGVGGGDEHLGGLSTQPQIEISGTRRNAPFSNDYGVYKPTSMPTNATHVAQHNSSNNSSSVSSYQIPSSSLNASNSLHQRVSAIGGGSGVAPAPGLTNANTPFMTKERIYEHQKYSTSSSAATAKLGYNTAGASTIYDSHHHHLNNQAIDKGLPIDNHVINPSNLPASKEQHPSPNYARKCPQMYAPEEQSTAHQHLYMSTPQFSSDKFTRASPQQIQPPPPTNDYTKLRESPSGSSYLVAPHSSPHMHASHLRESAQFSSHSTSSARNSNSYYGVSQPQNPSKIHPPEVTPIVMKQSHATHHYQYSKSPLPPPLPPSHMQQQTIPLHTSQLAAKSQPNVVPAPSAPPSHIVAGHSQRYLLDNVVKREDLEMYENANQSSSRHSSSGIYINPYNTPPPTGDNCCKEIALSASSSPYTTGSATPNYRVESPQFYPTKYAKLTMNDNLSSSKHSLINQNTPPPSRAPSQRGQHQSNYYYEGNSHSAPSPAAATAASPSPSAQLTTTSQTPMHHTEYISSTMQTSSTVGPPPPSQLVGTNMSHSYATQPTLSAQPHHMQHHQHPPVSASLRNNDAMLTAQSSSSNPYELAIHHPSVMSTQTALSSQHSKSKHVVSHPHPSSSTTTSGSVSSLQIQQVSANSGKSTAKHQKPNYRELINQKLAMRNATSEEELNMQIIKKTLNVDSQNIRSGQPNSSQLTLAGTNRGVAAPQLQPTERIQSTPRESSSTSLTKQTAPLCSVLVSHSAVALPIPSKARIMDLPETIPQRICIKQEDDKPSSSSGTTSSPLDLSMRTVKTKADSTDYKYQKKSRLSTGASSTTPSEGRYSLPRVDATPIFSVHAFEPTAAAATAAAPIPNRHPSSRHNSLERRNYTPPTQQAQISHTTIGTSSYSPSSSQHIPASSPHHQYGGSGISGTTRKSDLPKQLTNNTMIAGYENSLVIKTAPKLNNFNSDLVIRPSTITGLSVSAQSNAQSSRPSVLETNPYATVIKTESKLLNETPTGSTHKTITAVERLPPDTSIMPLPPRNPYGVVRSAIETSHQNANISNSNPTPASNYTLACEKNPNFLGRKRHLQEYSNQMSLSASDFKRTRYMDSTTTQATTKPQITMRPADISVIAVNDIPHEDVQRKSLVTTVNRTRTEECVSSVNSTSVIASTTNNTSLPNIPKVIVNNVNANSSNYSATSSVVVVCKQEPVTPTALDNPNTLCVKPSEMTNTFSSRIRTKAELKGFTFNPPPPPSDQTKEFNNSSPPTPPRKILTIKQEEDVEELIPAKKIKEETIIKIELPSIAGLNDEFQEKDLLDFSWSKTCNNFMEQLLTRSNSKKKTNTNTLASFNQTSSGKSLKDSEMQVPSSEVVIATTKISLENHNLSTIESADNTTRSSFAKLDASVESSITFNNVNQDSINSQSTPFTHKKLSKSEREKKRFQQEKRLAERLNAKESSSETEDELDKRMTERLKKPPMKTKHKLKSLKTESNTNTSSSSPSFANKNRFSDCGSDTSSTETEENKSSTIKKSPVKLEKVVQEKEEELSGKAKRTKSNEGEKCDLQKDNDQKENDKSRKKSGGENTKKPKEEKPIIKKEVRNKKEDETKGSEEKNSSATSAAEEEKNEHRSKGSERDDNKSKLNCHPKEKLDKQALNTMTRSKRKQELEQQLANSKVLRNDKIIRNFSASNSSNKIKRKYTRKYNTVNSLLESGGLSRESGIMKSTRLRAKLEKNGGKLNLLKTSKTKSNSTEPNNSKEIKNKPENQHDRNVIDLYRFKRALKVPPSLINIKHPGEHKIATSLPDLERHAEALDAYAKKREKSKQKAQNKVKTAKGNNTKLTKTGKLVTNRILDSEGPKSIIDLLHSRVTKDSGMNVRNKTTTTTAIYRHTKPCFTTTTNNTKMPLTNTSNNCGIFSETSQTTESSELHMLPELKKDSDIEDDIDDNESTNGKKRHFSIFETKVLPTKTRTESKLQQKKENIREIFVGDDRPASAPPEMVQMLDSNEKMTYEQKYEQFLQQMNIVVSADILGRLGRSSVVKKVPSKANGNRDLSSASIKQEEFDTESTSVIDADDLKEDQKSIPNHFRKRRGKYLRRKGSSGFDYIRKKKKPTTSSASSIHNTNHLNQCNNGSTSHLHPYSLKSEKYDIDEYEHKVKTEDDVSREIQKWVLNKGVGQSTMHKAARQGYIDVIVYCLDRMGMNPDQKDNAGYTPLHEACTNGWLNIARVLMQYGANHSEAAHSGIRPLHEASENDHEEVVRLLLSYGADPLLATYSGQTPLMLASSKTMRDILSNHLVDVQSMGPERKPWQFNGPWELYDPSECGYNVFEGAPNSICDMSRALLRRSSLTNNQNYQNNKKLLNVLNNSGNTVNVNTTTTTAAAVATTTTTNNFFLTSTASCPIADNTNNPISTTSRPSLNNNGVSNSNSINSSNATIEQGMEAQQQQQLNKIKGEINTKTVMEKCAVVLDNLDRFNSVRLHNDNKPEILVENSDSDGEMFEFEEADVLLPPLYLLKDEGTQDKWVLLNDLCNLLKVKSKDTLLNKIYPSTTTSTSASVASAHKSLMRELKMSDFLEKATCLQLLCAGEKLNICASKVVLIKYNENVRNLLGVKTILMKF